MSSPARPLAPSYSRRRFNPRIVIGVVLVVAVAAGFIAHGHSTPPTTTTPPVSVAPTTTTTVSAGPTTTAGPTIIPPSQSAFPAYQHMPYVAGGIVITVTGTAPSGRFEVEVFSQTLSLAQEHAIWNSFLHQYHDTGIKYLVAFAPAPPAG